MSYSRFCAGFLSGAVIGGGISAALGAAAGAAGAGILKAAGHTGYAIKEAVEMGAAGCGILGGGLSGLQVGFAAGGCTGGKANSEEEKKINNSTACGYVAGTVLGGMVGYGVFNAAGVATTMSLAKTAAAFAVGGAVTMIPGSCAIVCIALPLVAAGACCFAAAAVNDQQSSARPSMV